MDWADWKPRFDVEIVPSDVVAVEIGAVEYTANPKMTLARLPYTEGWAD